MNLHLETISDEMSKIAGLIHENYGSNFYLAGGTALALQIGHRKSIDLDYFSPKPIDTLKLKETLKNLFKDFSFKITFEEKNTLWCEIDGVKISFISRLENLYEPVVEENIFRLASLKDITLMKLSAICSREEYKDYFDLAVLAEITDPRSWIAWWEKIYPDADITSFVIALSAVRNIPIIPLAVLESYKNLNVVSIIENAGKDIASIIKG